MLFWLPFPLRFGSWRLRSSGLWFGCPLHPVDKMESGGATWIPGVMRLFAIGAPGLDGLAPFVFLEALVGVVPSTAQGAGCLVWTPAAVVSEPLALEAP